MTVAEVEEFVPTGAIPADSVHTPSIYVRRMVPASINEKRVEKLVTRAKE
jgi:3-oxoacid CoA-transferase subunit A